MRLRGHATFVLIMATPVGKACEKVNLARCLGEWSGDWGLGEGRGRRRPRNGLVTAGKLRSDRTRSEGPEGASEQGSGDINPSIRLGVRLPVRPSVDLASLE